VQDRIPYADMHILSDSDTSYLTFFPCMPYILGKDHNTSQSTNHTIKQYIPQSIT